MKILVVDDESALRRTIRTALESAGHRVSEAANQTQATQQVELAKPDLVLLDLRLGRESGLDVLDVLHKVSPGLGVIVITAHASIDTAVEAMRRGALDYLPKPFTPKQLTDLIVRWGGRTAAEGDGEAVVLDSTEPAMRQALETVFTVATSDATVLLRGESGTGKGVLARAVHARSRRAAGPFVTVHCPSLSSELLESELFGHSRGAFTGAVRTTEGKVAAAAGGTLFLDEVGDLPLPLQPKLLRLVQDRAYERVGETTPRTADVRIVAATNRNLEQEVATGRFREDLFYRLNVIEVTVPPLRDRRADLLPLADHLLAQFAGRAYKPVTGFTPAAREALLRHRWPGNVRELRNAIERAVLLCRESVIDVKDLPTPVTTAPPVASQVAIGEEVPIGAVEIEHIRRVLAASPTLEDAARTLGIDPSTLYRKRKRYGL
ncbi:sigma-54-dependent transcriptional regulator [Frigoriglobus tundricola]|uniref:Response regulator of zinc sigma-54-dependent two-component system n=1 Tax=Frigoriglobus tundricola TaxID=2774151 RepID=A0A6M5Z2Z0_9BACT|nr:sigma-54 dependent transcriptional regulator [Frigoriglobus tundricola]QJX00619.1 Response regulator of zinc sigma-54-dependent two-component system [Frigoriglobus tundricola]